MNRLLEIGFEPAGHWLLRHGALAFELSRHASQRNILYAFVSDGEVKYVGKTVQTLNTRMCGYKNPSPTQTTNVRNHSRIKTLLESNAAVDILALPDNGLLHYGQFHINLAAGLEDNIISLLSPEWNRGSSIVKDTHAQATHSLELDSSVTSAVSPASDHVLQESHENLAPVVSFSLVVQPTYLRQGFFNVGVENSDQFGDDGQEIEIFCGDADQPILGTINRTANTNETPRIMGGRGLRDWFQKVMSQKQEVMIAVLSPVSIRITPRNG